MQFPKERELYVLRPEIRSTHIIQDCAALRRERNARTDIVYGPPPTRPLKWQRIMDSDGGSFWP